MLLSYGTAEFIAERFERLVIGSGDHGFLGLALAAQALGVHVVILGAGGSVGNSVGYFGLDADRKSVV